MNLKKGMRMKTFAKDFITVILFTVASESYKIAPEGSLIRDVGLAETASVV
jgi:hypothetical protein